jgi:hypothetical protein
VLVEVSHGLETEPKVTPVAAIVGLAEKVTVEPVLSAPNSTTRSFARMPGSVSPVMDHVVSETVSLPVE